MSKDLHGELMRALAEWNPGLDGTVKHDTPLITSARLDSLGLFQMLVWIEQKIGRPVDATSVDLAAEWDTVDAVVAYIARERKRG